MSLRLSLALSLLFLGTWSYSAESTAEHQAGQASAPDSKREPGNGEELIPSVLIHLGRPDGYYSPYAFLVDKRERSLMVWQQLPSGWQKVSSFPADLGRREGTKTKRNDHRTPEGIYFLRNKLEGSGLDFNLYGSRAFTTDYPNFFDRLEGRTGDGIWLHAVPDKVPLTRGSRGCVVVRNNVIQELSRFIDLGKTPLVITDHLEMVSNQNISKLRNEIESKIDEWRKAWENKDIENYIQFYAEQFHAQKMDRTQWKEFKNKLNSSYKELHIKFSRPYVLIDRNRAVVRFLQDYQSDLHRDFGEKTLYLVREQNQFKIVGEDWRPEESKLAKEEISADTLTSATSSDGAMQAADPGSGPSANKDTAGLTASETHR